MAGPVTGGRCSAGRARTSMTRRARSSRWRSTGCSWATTAPLQWERTYGYTTDPSASWWGHCNGWAAASVLTPEPVRALRVRLQAASPVVDFNIGEIKGLLAVAHQAAPADYFSGNRRDSGATYLTDLRAGPFHNALLYYLYQRKEGRDLQHHPEAGGLELPLLRVSDAGPDGPEPAGRDQSDDDDLVRGRRGRSQLPRHPVEVGDANLHDPRELAVATVGGVDRCEAFQDHPQFVWHPEHAQAYDPGEQEANPIDLKIVEKLGQLSANVSNVSN